MHLSDAVLESVMVFRLGAGAVAEVVVPLCLAKGYIYMIKIQYVPVVRSSSFPRRIFVVLVLVKLVWLLRTLVAAERLPTRLSSYFYNLRKAKSPCQVQQATNSLREHRCGRRHILHGIGRAFSSKTVLQICVGLGRRLGRVIKITRLVAVL
jgi:hypothetical protein